MVEKAEYNIYANKQMDQPLVDTYYVYIIQEWRLEVVSEGCWIGGAEWATCNSSVIVDVMNTKESFDFFIMWLMISIKNHL
jgi:hypothetical protein